MNLNVNATLDAVLDGSCAVGGVNVQDNGSVHVHVQVQVNVNDSVSDSRPVI